MMIVRNRINNIPIMFNKNTMLWEENKVDWWSISHKYPK